MPYDSLSWVAVHSPNHIVAVHDTVYQVQVVTQASQPWTAFGIAATVIFGVAGVFCMLNRLTGKAIFG